MLRKPMVPAYRRFESTGADEKVKGAVIGIDLGKQSLRRTQLAKRELTISIGRHHKLGCCHHGRQDSQDH